MAHGLTTDPGPFLQPTHQPAASGPGVFYCSN